MPQTPLVLYREGDGSIPLLDWFDALPTKAHDKCVVRLERLRELGHELRRPEADFLRDSIYELRAKHADINYRMLYFFHGQAAVVVSHGFAKQQAQVPPKEIKKALERMRKFEEDPETHSHERGE